ncbi:MAG TPA: carboxypeptidase-like regulatory domain-containing protein [Candidatus Acidoferrales bacterium]|nr:carboxypeptidase-like regulatory domain-containing protein [Candidatus Acidoferrales bacterium]
MTPVALFALLPLLPVESAARAADLQPALDLEQASSAAQKAKPSSGASQQSESEPTGTVAGTVVDPTGALIPGAHIKITAANQSTQETVSDASGQFYFLNVPSGNFQLNVSATNFTTEIVAGTVHAGEHYVVPEISLALSTTIISVTVTQTQEEIAQEQVKLEEHQRVLGFIPNFYVSYIPDAAPLTPKQKFNLAWRSSTDPISIALVGALAGVQQATNQFKGYGQGAQGYGKRFGATYADVVDGTFLGGAVLPSILHQDPRYFYKGTGSFRSRLLYAFGNAFICKGDNKKWQPNYSNILGNLAAGGIANAYYPASNRGAGLTFETAGIRIGETAVAGIFQEFIVRKLTPNLPSRNVSQP